MKRASKTNKQPKMEQRADPRQKPKPTERSSVSYIERYRIGDTLFGIEDYLAPGSHFMPTEPHRRFRVWRNGCGTGQFDTLKASREHLFNYVINDIIIASDYAIKVFTENAVILDRLSTKEGIPELSRLAKFLEAREPK